MPRSRDFLAIARGNMPNPFAERIATTEHRIGEGAVYQHRSRGAVRVRSIEASAGDDRNVERGKEVDVHSAEARSKPAVAHLLSGINGCPCQEWSLDVNPHTRFGSGRIRGVRNVGDLAHAF